MTVWEYVVLCVDGVARESMLLAAAGFVLGGVDDLALDLVYLVHFGWQRTLRRQWQRPTLDDFQPAPDAGRIAIFVAAWDEAAVIGRMLIRAAARFDHPNWRLYVGTYPNDRATIDAVARVSAFEPRIKLVIGERPGPTTKADNLNGLWRALLRDERREGAMVKAIVLHDAEDMVHRGELRVFDRLVERHCVVQLPIQPLKVRGSPLVSGHYADEFAEQHTKALVVRRALGASLPLAGTGCAIARDCLGRIADARDGEPFDASSLTEDYELGLHIAASGGDGILARVPERPGGRPVAVCAHFPATLTAAVRQKARWMTGIALAGWDRTGWGRRGHLAEYWMRLRDRRAPFAVLVLAAAYLALVAWAASRLLHAALGTPPDPLGAWLDDLLVANAVLMAWRLPMRIAFTSRAYGWREGLWSLPRLFVANVVALLAARRAVATYLRLLRGNAVAWDKTAHAFPDDLCAQEA